MIPSDTTLKYAVISVQHATTGNRMHNPLRITKKLERGAAPGNVIHIDEDGSQLAFGKNNEAVAAARARVRRSRANVQDN